ncbi:MAG: hisA/hisF family protein [Planctomycetes bacterium]|nr:hisA/hisF family protein [Planctomycetota bacterium]
MRIIPVIDIKDGQAVHAVAGKREAYRPVKSRLTTSSDPVDLAKAYRDRLGLGELYVADLDAIGGMPPAVKLYGELADLGLKVMVDTGIQDSSSLEPMGSVPVDAWIVGLETVSGPEGLAGVVEAVGADRAIFSLDMRDRQPVGRLEGWGSRDAMGIARQALGLGVNRMILIDLAQVGMGRGTGTEELARALLVLAPKLELLAGGGVRSLEDLEELRSISVAGALLATVLHNGRVGREAIRSLA